MIDISEIATNLAPGEDGIWSSKCRSQISYPEDGNTYCNEIEDRSFWFKHRNKCIIEVIRLYSPQGTIFEVGGGNGFVSQAIVQLGEDVVLVEPGLSGVRNAHSRGIKKIICATFQDAGFKPHSLPAVGLFDVLEHIEDAKSFLQTIKGSLVTNGRLYMTVPAYKFLWSGEDINALHYRRYTCKSLSKLLESVGFRIDVATYIFSVLPFPIFFFRTIPAWLGIRKELDIKKIKKEHYKNRGMITFLLNWMLEKELSRLKSNKIIPFGGSCLVVSTSY